MSMTAEAAHLVSRMVHNKRRHSFSVSFAVGGRLDDYRRLFRAAIEKRQLILFEDTAAMICFGHSALSEPCTITYVSAT